MNVDDAERLLARSSEGYDALEAQPEELVAAVRALAAGGRADEAAELAWNVWRVWMASGHIAGGRAALAAALDAPGAPRSGARARALYADGLLAFRAGAQDESRSRNEEALELARELRDREAESLALVGLSRVAFRDAEYARVRSLASEARELTGDLGPAAGAPALHLLAAGTRLSGDYDEAVSLYEESLELNRSLGNTAGVAMELHNLGHVELHRGNVEAAAGYFAKCEPLRDPAAPMDAGMSSLNEAALAYARGERDRALALLDATEATLGEAGIELDPDDAFEVRWLRERL